MIDMHALALRNYLDVAQARHVRRKVGVVDHADTPHLRRGLQQQFELLGKQAVVDTAQAGDVAARSCQAGDETLPERVAPP